MFSKLTKEVIVAAITHDGGVTGPERERMLMVLNGTFHEPPPPKLQLVTSREACDILGGISKVTLWNYAKLGRLHPIHRRLRNVRYDRAEVERLAYQGMNASDAEEGESG